MVCIISPPPLSWVNKMKLGAKASHCLKRKALVFKEHS